MCIENRNTHRYKMMSFRVFFFCVFTDRKQTSGYQRGEEREEGQIRGLELRDPNYYV